MVRTPSVSRTDSENVDVPRSRRTRRDFLTSRRELLDAAERLLARQGRRFSLADLAAEANMSTATAYRHFNDLDEALDAYYARLVESLVEKMTTLPSAPSALARFHAVCDLWVADASHWGRAAVQVRSAAGFLARAREGDELVGQLYAVLAPVVTGLVREQFIPPVDIEYATLIWATIFDERVVIDLVDTLEWPVERVSSELTAATLRLLAAGPDGSGTAPDGPTGADTQDSPGHAAS